MMRCHDIRRRRLWSGLMIGIMAFAYASDPLIAVIGILASGLIAFVIAYILGICLYSFGEVVENTTIIRKCLEKPDCPNEEN